MRLALQTLLLASLASIAMTGCKSAIDKYVDAEHVLNNATPDLAAPGGSLQTHPGLTGLVRPDGASFKQFGCIFTSQSGTDWKERFALNDAAERDVFAKGPDITFSVQAGYLAPCQVSSSTDMDVAFTAYLDSIKNAGGAPFKGIFDFKYKAMPTQAEINKLPAPPSGVTVYVFRVKNRVGGSDYDRGYLFRMRYTGAGGADMIDDNWVLTKDYQGPVSGTSTLLSLETPAPWSDPKAFLTAMIGNPDNKWWIYGNFSLSAY